MRAIALAIVVAAALAWGGGPAFSARTATSVGPALVADADPFGSATNDPSDPGLPPD